MSRTVPVALLLLAACAPPTERDADVLLVTVDTLRADHLRPWGARGIETPHLDGLFEEALVFERAWAPAPITTASLGSVMTSRSPRNHGALNNTYDLDRREWTLAEAFQALGRSTGAFLPTFLADKAGFRQGFDVYDTPRAGEPWRSGEEVVARALDWLRNASVEGAKPWFCWVHLFEPHSPYAPPRDLEERNLPPGAGPVPADLRSEVFGERHARTEQEVAIVRALYRAEVEATDRALGPLLDWARELPAATGRSVVTLFAADHGELLYEHDEYVGHTSYLYEEMLRIPLALHFSSGHRAGERTRFPASLLDVMPTLLSAVGAGYESPDGGLDLLSVGVTGDRLLVHETFAPEGHHDQQAVRFGERVLLLEVPGRGTPQRLFDLQVDPAQGHDRAPGDPRGAGALAETFARWAEGQRDPADAHRPALDAELSRLLEALGYSQRGGTDAGTDGRDDPADRDQDG